MIDLLKEFNSACEDLVKFQDVVRQTLAKVQDAGLKEHLQQLDREMEQALTEAEINHYERELNHAIRGNAMKPGPGYKLWHAEAPQRCEAFLRVRGLWQTEPNQ